jgi:hypothetical protein
MVGQAWRMHGPRGGSEQAEGGLPPPDCDREDTKQLDA